MKAVVYESFGDPRDVLHCTDVEPPVPRSGEVLVRMIASPINPSDLMCVEGGYSIQPELPATPGFEGVGVVEKSGGGLLGRLMVGKRVAVLNRDRGNWAEKTVTTARQVIPLPKHLPIDQAAMFFINPATAYILTRKILNVPAGAWLVQTAANSAVGRMIVRLGRMFDFKTLNIVRREEEIEKLKFLGGHEVITFDVSRDNPQELIEAIERITGGMTYAIDPVGGLLASTLACCLAENGQLVLYGSLSEDEVTIFPRTIMTPNASIRGFWLGGWMQQQSLLGKMSLVRTITKLILDGTLNSDVGEEFALDEIREAVRVSRLPGRGGKVLLRISDG